MNLIGELFRGMIILSFLAVAGKRCTVKKMAGKAADAHIRSLSSYGAYSRLLSGSNESWAKPTKVIKK